MSQSKKDRAFYEVPKDRALPSDIINEARIGVQAYTTARPSTPRTDNRNIYSLQNQRSFESRNSMNKPEINKQTTVPTLAPLKNYNSLNKINKTNYSKSTNEPKRISGAWDHNNDIERHNFNNVQNRTNSITNLSNQDSINSTAKLISTGKTLPHSESTGSIGLPPTSPTRNVNRSRTKSTSKTNTTEKVHRTVSPTTSPKSRLSSAETKPGVINPSIYRPDSASSCSSSSSLQHTLQHHQNQPSQSSSLRQHRPSSQSRIIKPTKPSKSPESESVTPRTNDAVVVERGDVANESASRTKPQQHQQQKQIYDKQIRPILDILGAPSECRGQLSCQDVIELTNSLYSVLQKNNMLGKECKYRTEVLKAVFKVLDSQNEKLVMSCARIILHMRVRGINLTNICRLMFNVSKNRKNDHLFVEFEIAEPLLKSMESIKPDDNPTALLNISCTLNMLTQDQNKLPPPPPPPPPPTNLKTDDNKSMSTSTSTNSATAAKFVEAGLFNQLADLLARCVKINGESPLQYQSNINFCEFIHQCLCCLINLEDCGVVQRRDLVIHLIPEMCAMLINQYSTTVAPGIAADNHSRDTTIAVIFSASRLLSRLTQYSDCCQQLERLLGEFCPKCLDIMLTNSSANNHHQLVLRIAFIVGDLLTKSEEARHALLPDQAALDILLRVFRIYHKKYIKASSNTPDEFNCAATVSGVDHSLVSSRSTSGDCVISGIPLDDESAASTDDILVKLLRVIANAAIAESVGRMLSCSGNCLQYILSLINSKKTLDKEELLSISISALNNLSFYMTSASNSEVKNYHLKIIETLYKLVVNTEGKDHLGGVIKVLGNLSRESYMRQWIVDKGLSELLITMLDCDNQDTVFFTVGVLLNLMTDPDKRYILRNYNGINGLIEVLRDFACRDWQLAGLVCQTIWNYTESIVVNHHQAAQSHSTAVTDGCGNSLDQLLNGLNNTEELLRLLTIYCDTEEVESLHQEYSRDASTLEYLSNNWQTEFLPVAQDLLARLETLIDQ